MKGKSQSPQDKTRLRIAKDKRQLERLIKEAQKHLVEGHSPVAFDFLASMLEDLAAPLSSAEKAIDNSAFALAADVLSNFGLANKDIIDSVVLYEKEYEQVLADAEMSTLGYLFEGKDKVEESWDDAAREAVSRVEKLIDDEGNLLRELDASNDYFLQQMTNNFNKFLDDAKINGGDENIGWMEALGAIPGIIVGIGSLLDSFVNLDPEKFVEDNIELAKAQKLLQERLSKEKI